VDDDDIENRAGIGGTGDKLPARASPTAARKRATNYGRDAGPSHVTLQAGPIAKKRQTMPYSHVPACATLRRIQ
jgi:hypothetical protein